MKKYEKVVIVIRETADDLIKMSNDPAPNENGTPPMPLTDSLFTWNG